MLRVRHGVIYERKRFTTAQIIVAHIGTIRAVLAHIFALPDVAQAIEIPYFGGLHASLMAKDHASQNQVAHGKFISWAQSHRPPPEGYSVIFSGVM